MARTPLSDDQRMMNIVIPIDIDRQIRSIQDKYEDAGMRRPSKSEICVQLITRGLQLADFDDLVKLQEEIDFDKVAVK